VCRKLVKCGKGVMITTPTVSLSDGNTHHQLVASLNPTYMSCIAMYIIVPATVTRGRYSIIFYYNSDIIKYIHYSASASASASVIQTTTTSATARSNSSIRICGNSVCASQKYLQYDHLKSSLSQ